MQGSAGVTLQRGHCSECGQQWVLGKIDSTQGEYGKFYCAACWDRNADDRGDNIAGYTVEKKPNARGRRSRRGQIDGPHRETLGDLRVWAREFLQLPRSTAGIEDDTIEVRDLRVGKGADQRVLHMVTDNVNEHFRSCGASVWLGSQVLLRFMEKELRSRRLESARIVELGAGCGLPGMGLAQLGCCDVDVVLTDVPSQCALLECNVALNFFKSGRIAQVRKNIPRVMPLLWGSRSQLDDFCVVEEQWGGFDYIIGSEIVYDEVSLPRLLRTLKTLAALPTETETASRIILAVGERAGEFSQFEQLAVRHGWNYEILSQVDLTASIGDPTCSPVSIVELFQSETRRRRSRSSSVGGFAAASWSDED